MFKISKHWNLYSFQRIPASDWSGRTLYVFGIKFGSCHCPLEGQRHCICSLSTEGISIKRWLPRATGTHNYILWRYNVSLHGEYISSIQVQYIVFAGWWEPFIPWRWCKLRSQYTIFRSSRKCPEEDHQPFTGKQFGITWGQSVYLLVVSMWDISFNVQLQQKLQGMI